MVLILNKYISLNQQYQVKKIAERFFTVLGTIEGPTRNDIATRPGDGRVTACVLVGGLGAATAADWRRIPR